MKRIFPLALVSLALVGTMPLHGEVDGKKKVAFLIGSNSHGYGEHEFKAGCLLMEKLLKSKYPDLITVSSQGWPQDAASFFQGADTIVTFCDGGDGHLLISHLKEFDALMDQGIGCVFMHYAVEVPLGQPGKYMQKWMGGYFEKYWSVNPHWEADIGSIPKHEVTQGVRPFKLNDEWYYHMRFLRPVKEAKLTPVLSTLPPKKTLEREDGPHSNNLHVKRAVANKEPQHLAWAYERPDGKGRGFGITGFHYHWGFYKDSMRKLILNSVLWTAHMPVPKEGVVTTEPDIDELKSNIEKPEPAGFKPPSYVPPKTPPPPVPVPAPATERPVVPAQPAEPAKP